MLQTAERDFEVIRIEGFRQGRELPLDSAHSQAVRHQENAGRTDCRWVNS